MKVLSKLSGANIAPQKARLVANLIRGESVQSALQVLEFSPKKGAALVKKVLGAAVASAENDFGLDVDDLVVDSICVDEGPTLKRIKPRAKGRADRILKRTCHIALTVSAK